MEDLRGSVLSALALHVVPEAVVGGDIAGLVRDVLALKNHLNLGLLLLDLFKRTMRKNEHRTKNKEEESLWLLELNDDLNFFLVFSHNN